MILFKKAGPLTAYIQQQKSLGKTVGFVPTMGALHKGHISLLALSKQQTDIAVCSIFVNPTQFNDPEDFKRYPVTVEKDIAQLSAAGADILFLPSVEEIYPPNHIKKQYGLGEIETLWEGHYRPGHFQGVCEVVDRLLNIVQPNQLHMGQKDYQQCMVIKKLLALTGKEKDIQLHIVPTQREASGLAMSSRNQRLSPDEKQKASSIYQALHYIKDNIYSMPPEVLMKQATAQLQEKGFTVDYIAIADAHTLQPATDISKPLIALAAAYLGKVRLIDNLLLN